MNPARDWLESLRWDGVSRVADLPRTWLRTPREHHASASRIVSRWLVDAVRRAFDPGCEVGPVPVFIGPQGCGKSYFLRALGGVHHIDIGDVSGLDDRERATLLHAAPALVVAINPPADDPRAARWLGAAVDVWRPIYAHDITRRSRGFVFAGTSNDPRAEYHGCEVVRLDKVAHITEATCAQVWAEAVTRAEVRHA